MLIVAVTIAFALALAWAAWRADARFRDRATLPMQWWATGEVTWSAPRAIALAFVPGLSILVLVLDAVGALTLKARPGQEGFELPVLVLLGVISLGCQRFHLWMIGRWLNGWGSNADRGRPTRE